jgi:hypothetical protein
MSGELVRREEVAELVGQLAEPTVDRRERGRLLARLSGVLASSARSAGAGATLTGRWLGEVVAEAAPYIQVRDLPTLREHSGGLSGEDLAAWLVRQATLATAGVGAAGGALAAAQHAAPPSLVLAPVQLAAETLAVVAVEVKLVAELHVSFAAAPQGSAAQLGAAYLAAWATKSRLDGAVELPGLDVVIAAAARQQLRRRVARRLARNLATLAPLLAGAVAGAELNRRETRSLGLTLIEQLRRTP